MEDRPKVAVIGGGYAGCAAAATLASRGVRCMLFETAAVLGGRGRRVERDGLRLDNGQHLLLGAYAATLALRDKVGARQGLLRRPLAIVPFSPGLPNALTLQARRAPGRIGLLIGLLATRGLTWRERLANVAWFRALERTGFARPRGETVAQLLAPLPPRVAKLLWEPLNLAALNTPAESASAQIFANVLEASFARRGEDSDFVLPTADLSEFFPEQAARYLREHGGVVAIESRAQVASANASAATVAAGDRVRDVSAVIVAVGPHQLDRAFAKEYLAARPDVAARIDALAAMRYEPIVTVWLGYPTRIDLPGPVARLDDAPGQWVVDRPDVAASGRADLAQVLAVVISAGGPHMTLSHEDLVRATDAQLRRLAPALPDRRWSFVVAEKRATYACTPDRPRPGGPRFAPGVYLAGDYVNEDFPATLEAATRSGVAAAEAFLADARSRQVSDL
jgi:squalene-associated FAD-dependent desaturase